MGLPSFKFVQWAPKDASLLQQSACRKRIMAANSCSGSFKVIHFAISYRPTRVSIPLYNIAGLISEDSEEVAIQITKNCRRRAPHSDLTPPPRGSPANIPISLPFPDSRIIGLHFSRRLYGSIFIHICAVGSKRRIFSAKKWIFAVQGHSRSMILVPIESAHTTSY